MAKGKNQDENPEDSKKKNFNDDDDDFGLPDLEYNELVDDGEEFDDDLNIDFDDLEESKDAKEPANKEKSVLNELDDFSEINFDNDIDDVSISDEDLKKELDEMEEKGLDMSDEEIQAAMDEPEFYEEESFEEFEKKSVLDVDNKTQQIKVEPVAQAARVNPFDSMATTKIGNSVKKQSPLSKAEYSKYNKKEENSFTKIVIIGIIVISIIAVGLYYISGVSEVKEEPLVVVETPKPEPVIIEEPKPEPKTTVSKPAAGTVTAFDARTGKSYIVINSFIDGDLAQDYANILATQGKSPYLLAPVGSSRFYRVAIAEYTSYDEANNSKSLYQGEFGKDVWTLRY